MRTRLLPLLLLLGACGAEEAPGELYQAVPVARRDIVVAIRAAGMIQPDTVVEVKSKASGEILDIRVETGQLVRAGELLVRVDQRTARNRLAQSQAELDVAKARLTNAQAQKRRADELFQSQSITQEEHENAILALANANSEVVRGEVSLENAQISMDDTDVLSPIRGTVIAKNVERGQVISSPTSDVGGGTVLLTMADLNLVQVRTLVDETDIGKVQKGLASKVTVDAFPNQPFDGEVLKIEPQAETQQNVTMFPVLVRIDNRNGLLKPGMNADVEISVGRRSNVLALPNSSLRTVRDVGSAAAVLRISPERLSELMAAADARRDSAAAAGQPGTDSTSVSQPSTSAPTGNTMTLGDRTVTLPEGVTEDKVRELMRKRFAGGQLSTEEQALMTKIQSALGGGRGGAGGRPGGASRQQGSDYQFGGDYVVFVKRPDGPTPVHVRTGLTDLDYSEVVSGLTEVDSVIVLPSASLVRSQEQWKERIGRFNQGVPGMRQTNTTTTQTATATPRGGSR